MIAPKVRAILAADSAVAALVGARIYIGPLPQAPAYPAINIYLITHNPDNHLAGPGSLKWERLQVNAWGATYAEADKLIKAIAAAINGKKFPDYGIGSIVGQISGGYNYEESVKVHQIHLDFGIWF